MSASWWRPVCAPLLVLALTGCLSQQARDEVDRQLDNGMTSRQVMTAMRVAAHRARTEHAHVLASATLGDGTVPASAAVHHRACASGHLRTITLTGRFPRPTVQARTTVQVDSEVIVADARSGVVCGDSFHVRVAPADPNAVSLFSD